VPTKDGAHNEGMPTMPTIGQCLWGPQWGDALGRRMLVVIMMGRCPQCEGDSGALDVEVPTAGEKVMVMGRCPQRGHAHGARDGEMPTMGKCPWCL